MPLVCIDCRYIGPKPSGIAKVVQALVDFIPPAAPDIDFLLLRHPAASAPLSPAENVREVVVGATANSPATMWYLPRIVDLTKVDLFHATFNIMPAGLRMPCITTVHDIMWLTNPQWCNPRFAAFAERWFYQHGIRRALRKSAAITTVSTASRDAIADYNPSVAGKLHVTPLGVCPQYRKTPVSEDDLVRIGLPRQRKFVLVVGQNAPYKNHTGALRIFAQIADTFPDVDLVFVQRISRNSRKLEVLRDQLGLGGRVRFLASVGETDLVRLFNAAEALLHPSLCEGFGLPLAEAMACGCPIVTSDQSAPAEVVGEAGLLAAPEDIPAMAMALHAILASPALRTDLQQRGIKRSEAMSWRTFADANLTIYRKVLGLSDPVPTPAIGLF